MERLLPLLVVGVLATACAPGSEPEVLASGEHDPNHLAIANGRAFWIGDDGQSIRSVSLSGGTPRTVVEADATALAVDGDDIFWATSSGEIDHRTSDGAVTVLGKVEPKVYSMVADDQAVFVASNTGAIVFVTRVSRIPGGITDIDEFGIGGDDSPRALVADAEALYIAQPDIERIAKDGIEKTVVAQGALPVDFIALQGDFVYWAQDRSSSGGTDELQRAPTSGGDPQPLLHDSGSKRVGIRALASGPRGLYWMRGYNFGDCGQTALWYLPDLDSSPVNLTYLQNPGLPSYGNSQDEIVADAMSVYFTIPCEGQILRYDH